MPEVTVSIITPVYNGEQYLSEAIESALAQTYKNFELLIVNDGSTDNSTDIIRPFLKDSRVIYIEQKNAGVAAARNTAIKQARGKYIGFLDQDDLWLPEKINTLVTFLEKNVEWALVHTPQIYIDNLGNEIIAYEKDFVRNISGDCFKELFEGNKIAVLTTLVRKELIEKVGGFKPDVSRADDYLLWLELSYQYIIGYVDIPLVKYRLHDTNESYNSLKMEIAELGALINVLDNYPGARKRLGRYTIRERLYSIYLVIARSYLWLSFDKPNAHKYYRQALKYKPWKFNTLKDYFWTGLSDQQRKNISWYYKNILG